MLKPKVLFLCSGNTARSQMAEAFLRRYAGDHFEVHSAGLEPSTINPLTVRVMEEIGFDLSPQRSKDVTEYLGKMHFGYLVTVCARAEEQCPTVFPGVGKRLHWAFDDPAAFDGPDEAKLHEFRRVRDQIDRRIQDWLADLSITIQR
jgi:arsenate reductase (thioredoxin)